MRKLSVPVGSERVCRGAGTLWGVSVGSNLTPHADGIAAYSDAELGEMITRGVRTDGRPMMPLMRYAFLSNMIAEDTAAIILDLRTLSPLPDAG